MALTPRQYHQQALHFLRLSIAYTDNGKTLEIGCIPAGSLVLAPLSGVHVTTAFNGDATNTVDIGASTDSGTNNLGATLSLAATDFVPTAEATGTFLVAVDTTISCLVTSTASASAGAGEVVICYFPDIDG